MLNLLVALSVLAASIFTFGGFDHSYSSEFELYPGIEVYSEAQQSIQPEIVTMPLARPVTLNLDDANHLRLRLSQYGAALVATLSLKIQGPGMYLVEDRGQAGPLQKKCMRSESTGDDGPWTCRFVIRTGKRDSSEFILSAYRGDVIVSEMDLSLASAKRYASISPDQLYNGFILLFLIGPLLAWCRKAEGVYYWVLSASGLIWLALGGMHSVVLGLGFILAGYACVTLLASVTGQQKRLFLAIIILLALLLVLIKFIAPHVASTLANPGGFWLALPLGISYFAIRIIDLVMSVYSGLAERPRISHYLAFMLLPHTLSAGPIFTFDQFRRSAIENYGWVDFSAGTARVCVGICKKTLADVMLLPLVVRNADGFLLHLDDPSSTTVMVMLVINLAYVYLDFSAYCDLAVGSARCAGIRVPENFDWPLVRAGVRDYWRHWHMTLSGWVMRRVYFPAFLSSRSQTMSLIGSMMVIGLWHVPNLSWASWAVHHGLGMAMESRALAWGNKAADKRGLDRTSTGFRYVTYLIGVLFTWYWVSLGHSFTLFSDIGTAYICYLSGLLLPVYLFLGMG